MNYPAERRILCETGLKLVEKGLVARTWGNLSIRVSDNSFLISPSGRTYESIEPEDIALVDLTDLSWDGPLKPSAEKELHARVLRVRRDAKAIIHTHQPAASSIAAARAGFALTSIEDIDTFGKQIPCVPYALPTTTRLAKAVEKVVTGTDYRALLLSNHGAVCIGNKMDKAIQIAVKLEIVCQRQLAKAFRNVTGYDGETAELIEHFVATGGRF